MKDSIQNIVHFNLSQILTNNGYKKNFKKGLYLLKKSKNYKAKIATFDRLINASQSFYKYLFGIPFPKSIIEVGASKRKTYSEDVISEIDWLTICARKYPKELNLFIIYKNDFEKHFLFGEYEKAESAIDKIENYFGFSLWSLNSRILIYEYTSQKEQAKILLSEVMENNKDGVFTTSLLNFLSQRSEKKLSAHKYDIDLKGVLNSIKSNLDNSNKEFYNFYLNFFKVSEYSELKDVLSFDFSNSLIDRYLSFRKVVIYAVVKGERLTEVLGCLDNLLNKINDDLFNSISLLFNSEFEGTDFYDKEYLKIIDLYYMGVYDQVSELVIDRLNNGDLDFDLVNIYSKSLVLNREKFKPLTPRDCLLNNISEYLYNVYSRVINPTESLYCLYQISKNIESFDFNYSLSTWIKREQNEIFNDYSAISCKKANPLIVSYFDGQKEVINTILSRIKDKTYNSISLNYLMHTTNNDVDDFQGISNGKISIDKAKYFYKKAEYEKSLELWNLIYDKYHDVYPLLEVSINYIYKILFETGKLYECIKWYVDSAVKNSFLVYKIDASGAHTALRKGRFKNVTIDIYLPLFISFVSNDDNEKSFSIELYCKSKDVRFPTELISQDKLTIDSYFEIFLSHACSNDTLNYFKHLNTTKKRLDERISICNFLVKSFPEKSELYSQELNLLTNELIIYEGTQKLDESKIYANDQAILNKELDEYEGLYNRYITIAGLFLKNKKILIINKNEVRYLDKKGELEYTQNELGYSKNADLETFYTLFSVIRDKFLYSKFGIVTYLSTRIRHGVMLGELRPELEKNNLIFYKSKLLDKYEPNSKWINNPHLTKDEKVALTEEISKFSERIDALIDFIIKTNIQIKVNGENEDGWFDYDFTDYELREKSVTLYYEDNYKEFCKKVLDILWKRTDDNLDKIRNILQNSIKTNFVDVLNEFESELHKKIPGHKITELFTALSASTTTIQFKIDKIAMWFKRSGKTHSDFELRMLLDIICSNVAKAHPFKELKLELNNSFNHMIKGEYYEHFNDFIRILIENIFKHTVGNKISCKINIFSIEEKIVITVENNCVSPDIKMPTESYGSGYKIDGLKLISEGKSGLMKVRKIIKDDLRFDQNDLFVEYDKDLFHVKVVLYYKSLVL